MHPIFPAKYFLSLLTAQPYSLRNNTCCREKKLSTRVTKNITLEYSNSDNCLQLINGYI